MIVSSLIAALFVASGLFAVFTLVQAWRNYGTALRTVHGELALLNDVQEYTVRIAVTETREFLPVARRGGIRARAALRRQGPHAARAAA